MPADDTNRPFDFRKLYPLLLLAAVVLVYQNSFHGVFVFDDIDAIVSDQRIRSLTPWSKWARDARPLVTVSLAFNYAFGELNPVGYHIFNTVIHGLAGLALFGVVRRLVAAHSDRANARPGHDPGVDPGAYPGAYPGAGAAIPDRASALAFAVALVWLVHPLNTQAVTYVIQRAESMMGLFFLLTLYASIRASTAAGQRAARGWSVLAVAACFTGMACKQVMVVAPLVVLVVDRTLLTGSFLGALRRNWLLYLGLGLSWLVLLRTTAFGAQVVASDELASAGFGMSILSSGTYFLSQPAVILHYLRLAVWPDVLCLDYDWRPVKSVVEALPALIAVSAIGLTTLWALWKRWWPGVAGAAFFLILGPTSSFMPIADLCVEHRMYLPLAAVVSLVVLGGYSVLRRVEVRLALPTGVAILVVAAAALAWRTADRNRDYHDALMFWRVTMEAAPHNAKAHHNLANQLYRAERVEEAKHHWRRAMELAPRYYSPVYELGLVLLREGKADEALALLEPALQLPGRSYRIHYALGCVWEVKGDPERAMEHFRQVLSRESSHAAALNSLGALLAQRGQFDEAAPYLRRAAEARPEALTPQINLAIIAELRGDQAGAVDWLKKVLAIDPDHVEAHWRLGRLYMAMRQPQAAAEHLERAVALDPSSMHANEALADFLLRSGRFEEAALRYQIAGECTDDRMFRSRAANGQGIALAELGRTREALERFTAAAELDPRNVQAHANAAAMHQRLGDLDAAAGHLRQAIELDPANATLRQRLDAIEGAKPE